MDFLDPILFGFGVVLTPTNLVFCLLGVTLGMVIGVLPGLGPTATIAILLPVTYAIPSETAIIMLAGIYYGAQYGGTITSVLLSLPGEASTVVTTFDGYQMARTGRAGNALGIAAVGSFIGATISIVAMTFVAPVVAGFALDFGPPEYTALAVLGILLVSTLGTGAPLKCAIAALLGLLLATVGRDPIVGAQRFTFDVLYLTDGFDFVPIVMGLFGLGEILYQLGARAEAAVATSEVGRAWISKQDFRQSRGAIARGSVIGFFLGILPGGGATLASLVAYGTEKRRSKTPERFGKGAIEGVAGPESANNAAATSSFIPLLTLGIPANSTMAIIFGALLLQGISPGPLLITNNPEVFWGVIDSMYIGNLFLLILSVPMVGLFIRIVRVRASILSPITVVVIMLGVYTVNTSFYDMLVVIGFGILGYLMKKYGFEPGPLVLAFVLGGLLETAFRQSLRIFNGDLLGFVERPISGTLFGAVVLFAVVLPLIRYLRKGRSARKARAEDESKADVGA
ncbi:tripartite tricarboxylate transporter permease [Blastococcus sp. VKM Ac-2987]|uniref:tripartite tricarboxylate transporter permease n=1 Tax=Blastococcus sp. VKM Ac-2987 TaxID=3004141 RepID=UPI0022AB54A4|nr:tripartite tricarboxylate transporter permease [Blastococcus sp. VKM Ac-2987]MCZ2856932.1 tripartite tricarboxylate transporter permease [Blastococcus sp. VKM Ac-2987]